MSHSVLIVEDDSVLAKNLQTYLTRHQFEVFKTGTGSDGLAALERHRPDFALVDLNLPDMSGVEVLMRIRALEPHTQVIMMTGAGSVQAAVDAMKAGALDYLTKPLVLKELKLLLDKAVADGQRDRTLRYYQDREAGQSGLDKIIGQCATMADVKNRIRQFLQAEAQLGEQQPPTVLIVGETGTGKELVARAFHFDGPRRNRPFIEINCAAIPAQLLEAELFGYERGAFTDAKHRKLGLVEAANGGTLFLDEIGEMDLSLQSKLLTLLENRSVRRIGSLREMEVDVRIVAATNRDLEAQVSAGRFRSDLYYRLRVIQIALPPLRERGDDLRLLAEHFLSEHAARYQRESLQFTGAALTRLRRHPWPGNIRELRNSLEQAILLCTDDLIDTPHLLLDEQAGAPMAAGVQATPTTGLTLEQQEIQLIRDALRQTGGNVTRAATLLGLSRDTLRYRLAKYAIKV